MSEENKNLEDLYISLCKKENDMGASHHCIWNEKICESLQTSIKIIVQENDLNYISNSEYDFSKFDLILIIKKQFQIHFDSCKFKSLTIITLDQGKLNDFVIRRCSFSEKAEFKIVCNSSIALDNNEFQCDTLIIDAKTNDCDGQGDDLAFNVNLDKSYFGKSLVKGGKFNLKIYANINSKIKLDFSRFRCELLDLKIRLKELEIEIKPDITINELNIEGFNPDNLMPDLNFIHLQDKNNILKAFEAQKINFKNLGNLKNLYNKPPKLGDVYFENIQSIEGCRFYSVKISGEIKGERKTNSNEEEERKYIIENISYLEIYGTLKKAIGSERLKRKLYQAVIDLIDLKEIAKEYTNHNRKIKFFLNFLFFCIIQFSKILEPCYKFCKKLSVLSIKNAQITINQLRTLKPSEAVSRASYNDYLIGEKKTRSNSNFSSCYFKGFVCPFIVLNINGKTSIENCKIGDIFFIPNYSALGDPNLKLITLDIRTSFVNMIEFISGVANNYLELFCQDSEIGCVDNFYPFFKNPKIFYSKEISPEWLFGRLSGIFISNCQKLVIENSKIFHCELIDCQFDEINLEKVKFYNRFKIINSKSSSHNVEFRKLKFGDNDSSQASGSFRALTKFCQDAGYEVGAIFFHKKELQTRHNFIKKKMGF